MVLIAVMTTSSAFGVFLVSYPEDPGYGPGSIVLVGLGGLWYVGTQVRTQRKSLAKVTP